MIFTFTGGTTQQRDWFREAIANFWSAWYGGPLNEFLPLATRVEVQWVADPGPPGDNEYAYTSGFYDAIGLRATTQIRSTLDVTEGKQFYCESVVHEFGHIIQMRMLEDDRWHPGAEERIQRMCELFGVPRSAWNAGPWERRAREACTELIKDRAAAPALHKYTNRTQLRLQLTGATGDVGGIVSGDVGDRARGFAVDGSPAPPILFEGVPPMQSTNFFFYHGEYYWYEAAPAEWLELVSLFNYTLPIGGTGDEDDPAHQLAKLTWPVSPPQTGTVSFTGRFQPSGTPGSTVGFPIFEGEYVSTPGAEINWTSNFGWRLGFPGHKPTDFTSLTVYVYDANGALHAYREEFLGSPRPPWVADLTGIDFQPNRETGIGMWESDRLPLTRLLLTVYGPVVENDDQASWEPPVASYPFEFLHYIFAFSPLADIPPWPAITIIPPVQPGVLAIGPGVRGSHPTVRALRGGRVVGSRDLRSV